MTPTPAPPSDPGVAECLYCFLVRTMPGHGCVGLQLTQQWADARPRLRGVVRWARSTGGYCDCEVMMNSFAEHWALPAGLLCTPARDRMDALDREEDDRWLS